MQKRTLERLAPVCHSLNVSAMGDYLSIGRGSRILPTSPTVIFDAMLTFHEALIEDSLYTLLSTSLGFGIAVVFGLLLGLLIGWSKTIYRDFIQ